MPSCTHGLCHAYVWEGGETWGREKCKLNIGGDTRAHKKHSEGENTICHYYSARRRGKPLVASHVKQRPCARATHKQGRKKRARCRRGFFFSLPFLGKKRGNAPVKQPLQRCMAWIIVRVRMGERQHASPLLPCPWHGKDVFACFFRHGVVSQRDYCKICTCTCNSFFRNACGA